VLPDGSTASQVIGPDGNVVFEAGPDIPDEENLQFRYAADSGVLDPNGDPAAVGDTAETIEDLTDNGFDLSANGAPELRETSGGLRYLFYDGDDDYHSHSQSLGVTQPAETWLVAELETADGSRQDIITGDTSGGTDAFLTFVQNGVFKIYSGTNVLGGSEDTDRHIIGGIFDGGSSAIDFDGSEVSTGDVGSRDLDNSFYVGANGGGGNAANVRVHEILGYVNRDDSRRSDLRSYLSDKWGVTLS